MTKKILLIIAVIAAVTGSGAAYYRANAGEDAPDYQTSAVTRGDVVQTVDATGTLEAVTTVQVSTQLSGTIKALHADYNSQVKKGQVVAELEPSLMQTQVEQAQASVVKLQADAERARVDVDDTRAKLQRANELWKQQLIPRTDLETADTNARQAEAAVKSAEAQVAQARASLNQNQVNLGHTIIRAPIDGIVISRSVDVGQTVAASTSAPTLFVIAQDLGHMQVNASIDESDIGRIQTGQPVTFKVDAYPGDVFRGTVSQVRLEPKTESNVVSYVTIIDVPNKDLKLKPGMTANVTVEIARAENVLRVPASALRFRPATAPVASAGLAATTTPGTAGTGGASVGTSGNNATAARRTASRGADANATPAARVFVLDEGAPHPVRVEAGISDGLLTAIVGGDLSENTPVITGTIAKSTAAAATSGSPLLPLGGRGRTGGGNGAGGAAASRNPGGAR